MGSPLEAEAVEACVTGSAGHCFEMVRIVAAGSRRRGKSAEVQADLWMPRCSRFQPYLSLSQRPVKEFAEY